MTTPIAQGPVGANVRGWMPIETAPKDGTAILVYTQHDNFYVVSYDDVFSAPWRVRNDAGLNERALTHWMPLPEAPNDRVEGRDAALSRRVPSHDGLCPDGGAE